VAFENGSLLKKHLARLLQNAFIFFESTPHGKVIIQTIATSVCLGEDFSGKDLRVCAMFVQQSKNQCFVNIEEKIV